MRLEQISEKPAHQHKAESTDYTDHSPYKGATNEKERLHNHFRLGVQDFNVSLGWPDVEAIVRAFSKIGHPEAMRFERARKLAAAVEEFANTSN